MSGWKYIFLVDPNSVAEDISGVDSDDVLCQVVDSEGIRESIVARASSSSGAPPTKFRIIGRKNIFMLYLMILLPRNLD